MIETTKANWSGKRTDETRQVEAVLREAGFAQADAYRYNSASIRVRVVDPRFEGLSPEVRDAKVDRYLVQLDERTQSDIMTLLTIAPSEIRGGSRFRQWLANEEFEHPSESLL